MLSASDIMIDIYIYIYMNITRMCVQVNICMYVQVLIHKYTQAISYNYSKDILAVHLIRIDLLLFMGSTSSWDL